MHRRGSGGVVACALGCALLLLLTGCGETHVIPEGALEVHNLYGSDDTIHAIEIQEVWGPNFLAYDVWACPGDTVALDLFPSVYDVTVFWTDGGLQTYMLVEVFECCVTTVDVTR